MASKAGDADECPAFFQSTNQRVNDSTTLRSGSQMIRVNIEDIKPGMILARPVRNRQGVLLLDTGVRITDKNIRIFKSWGVREIFVKGELPDSSGSAGNIGSEGEESIDKQLREKFSDVLDDPVMVAIFKAASKQLMQDLQTSENDHEPA
jgi:hypothetical protein